MEIENGYLYIARDEQYIEEALTSVRSLKRVQPDAHATLITDKEIRTNDFDTVQLLDPGIESKDRWKGGLLYRVLALQNTPYKKTFFVDSDTYFCYRCDELFKLLDYFDLLLTPDPNDTSVVKINHETLEGYYPYNMGIIIFNMNQGVKKLLKDWLDIYQKKFSNYPLDQPAFMEALLYNHVKIYALYSGYNFRLPYFVSVPPVPVKILHGRPKSFKKIERIVNAKMKSRIWHPTFKKIYSLRSFKVIELISEWLPQSVVNLIKYYYRS